MLFFILLMIVANQTVVGLFRNTSSKLVTEYNELDAIQEFKLSLGKLLISTNNYVVHGELRDETDFKSSILEAREKLQVCKKVVTERHELALLDDFDGIILDVDSFARQMMRYNEIGDQVRAKSILENISAEIHNGIDGVNILLDETMLEIDDYVSINNTVIKHSTITVFTIGLIVILIILIGGILFIKSITSPIRELVTVTEKISRGDRNTKVNINTKDEFHTLAKSFNTMIDTLEMTTVSKDYLNNILENMFDALLVTDNQLKIRSVNQAALGLLGYEESALVGQHVKILFDESRHIGSALKSGNGDLTEYRAMINKQKFIKPKSGKTTPVLLSCAILFNQNEETDGLILVAHNLTEKYAIEQKLEQIRKEKLIDIYDAQEEERIRIATDLHDSLGQMLTAISYAVQELYHDDGSSNTSVSNGALKIQQQIDLAIKEAKNIAYDLIPIVLKDFGLIVAISNLISRANETYDTKFRFDAFDFNERIDPKLEKALYRICQETVNNIVKHADAENATYQIFWQDCSIVLVIEDDGVGFDTGAQDKKEKDSGIGLISIRERVHAFNGTFTINSETGQGTEIIVEIPCRKT